MSPEILDIATNPVALLAALVLGGIIATTVGTFRADRRQRKWRRYQDRQPPTPSGTRDFALAPWAPPRPEASPKPTTDAADQLRIVMASAFSARPLLNKSEVRVFQELDAMVNACNPHWQVMAQVSLGEILKSQSAEAYSCVNAKRVDLLLVDENCHPRHVVEYQGHGHHQSSAAARDAVKKEALRRAGIGYHEVVAGQTTPAELRQLVRKLMEVDSFSPDGNIFGSARTP